MNEVLVKIIESSLTATINLSNHSVNLADVRMPYFLLIFLFGIKFRNKLKEQLTSTHLNITFQKLFEENWNFKFLRNILIIIIIITIIIIIINPFYY